MAELLIGIDVGTSSTKGVLTRADGSVVATARRAHAVELPRPGWVEQDADAVWLPEIEALCRELVAQAAVPPAGVCVSGMGPCLLPADGDGRALRPAILYGVDTRAQLEIEELEERFGAQAILDAGGSPLTSQAIGPKLLWLQRHEPEVWARTRMLLMPSSLAIWRLTGEYALDHHSASQCNPLYALDEETWSATFAEQVAPGLPLPRLVWPTDVVGAVSADAAAATGLRAGTPVIAGTIDAWAEAASVGVTAPGEGMLMYGSTMFLVACVARLRPDPRLWGTAGVLPGSRTMAAGMAASGSLVDWLARLTGADVAALFAEAAGLPAGSDGLLALPYFTGERTPLFDPDARGVLCGLTLAHGRGHLLRALLEATAFGVRHNLEALADAGADPARLVAVGGGTTGSLWAQIVSDVTGRPQELPRERIGASYGSAWMAACGLGLAHPDRSWSLAQGVIEPDADAHTRYEELYGLYRDLYPATCTHVHALAEIAGRGSRAAAS